MKAFKRDYNIKLIFAIVLTILLPVGIVGIIFGAIHGITALEIICPIVIVMGFYGAPLAWVNLGKFKTDGIILKLIENENIYTVEDLSSQTMRKPENVRNSINSLILKGYLKGYLFKNDALEINTYQKQTINFRAKTKCPNCGGTMELNGNNFICPYCDNVVKKK